MKLASILRNNWKKTLFGSAVGIYGIHYGMEEYQISTVLKSCSKEAAVYGEQYDQYPKRVIVILNPAAKKKKAEKAFKKYCEPILHLAGFTVDIVRTDSEGYAKVYIEQLKTLPNAIIAAGGDGTVSEVVTGMMRRNSDRCPLALLPLGTTNDIAKKYLNMSFSSKLEDVESLIKASMNIVRGHLVDKSVIKIEQIASVNDEYPESRPIYALGYLQWGIFREMHSLQEKYWYFGKAKPVFASLLNAFNSNLTWACKADVCYSKPCNGCANCVVPEARMISKIAPWTNIFFKKTVPNKQGIVSNNKDCSEKHQTKVDSSNVRIYVEEELKVNKLVLEQREHVQPGYSFLRKYLSDLGILSYKQQQEQTTECRTMTLIPDESCQGSSNSYFIDNEVYDVRPINLTLIKNAIQLYN